MWHKLSNGHSTEIHVIEALKNKSPSQFQRAMNACLHLCPDAIARAILSGTTIVVSPQTNFTVVCWIIFSHFERKRWQSTPGNVKKWATDVYGRTAPLYWDEQKRVWEGLPELSNGLLIAKETGSVEA
jgi:hypothetical protein